MSEEIRQYFSRFGFCEPRLVAPPPRDLGLVVVIPCFDEPHLTAALETLWNCERPSCFAEILVVVNSSENSPPEVLERNQAALRNAEAWKAQRLDPRLALHLIHAPDLPRQHAGVGLARKIGMDEAVRRFAQAGQTEGVIACFDADCGCQPNYLAAVEEQFRAHPSCPACSIYFEHPLEGPLDPACYEAAARYELHLRYYVQAQRYAGFPHAFHTVGSCMAVRASAYVKQGGMNKRQAGEDFYFLQKVIPLGEFADLTTTTIYPSPRPSLRVPFGTGKAVHDFCQGRRKGAYPLRAFADLKSLFDRLIDFISLETGERPGALNPFSECLREFLERNGFPEALAEIRQNTSNERSFRKRFFHWFNAFRLMKFVHYARDRFYGESELDAAAQELLVWRGMVRESSAGLATRDLLELYRRLDREPRLQGRCAE